MTNAPKFEEFDLPADFHLSKVANRFWLKRTNRRNFFLWLASYLRLPNPSEEQEPWYELGCDDVISPIPDFRPFGKGVYTSWGIVNSELKGTYQLAIMDAFPEVDWEIWKFNGRFSVGRWSGFNLPHPDVEEITNDSRITHISGTSICRGFLLELGEKLTRKYYPLINISDNPSNWNESTWNDVTMKILNDFKTEVPAIGTFLRNGGCPVPSSLFSALTAHFDDVDFTWRPWLVGGRLPNGWGIPIDGNEEVAREQIRELLTWIVHRVYRLNLDKSNLELLYDIGQRTICQWYGGLRGEYWNGSPQDLIEFAYPKGPGGSEWDPTRFGLNKERQRIFYHQTRGHLTPQELALMNQQEREGWERRMTEFGLYPKVVMPDGYEFGGEKSHHPSADISVESRSLIVDVLGEDHFDKHLSRSKTRSIIDVERRFKQRQLQDLHRWKKSWSASYNTIAIGPNLGIDEDSFMIFELAIHRANQDGPSFQAIGWPEDSQFPEFLAEEEEEKLYFNGRCVGYYWGPSSL